MFALKARADRIIKLLELTKTDACVVKSLENRRYLTGLATSAGMVVITKKGNRYVYERFRVDNLIVGELAAIEKVLVIPEKIGNTPINYIEDSAFEAEAGIEEVVLHKNVKRIGTCAFKDCVNLRKITIPNKHIFIGSSAFDNTALLSNEDAVFYCNDSDHHFVDLIHYTGGSECHCKKCGLTVRFNRADFDSPTRIEPKEIKEFRRKYKGSKMDLI